AGVPEACPTCRSGRRYRVRRCGRGGPLTARLLGHDARIGGLVDDAPWTGTVCMSPRESKLDAIEALVCRDVGRKTQALIEASRGGLAAAAESLAGATSVGLITGFFVPRDAVAAPETDGPVGTALLAAALADCGVPARIAVDSPCAEAVRAAVHAAGGGVEVDEVGVEDRPGIERVAAAWRALGVSHAIGDGGNEIGIGKLPAGLIGRTVPNGDRIACITSCDDLIVAGVSNWGA